MNETLPRLQGRRVLITGTSSGIGEALAERCLELGARVAGLDIRPAADALHRRLHHTGRADIADRSAARTAVCAAAEALGGLDAVVNAAGVSISAPFAQTSDAQWDRALDVNLSGPFVVLQAALPWLAQSAHASVVNVSSGVAVQPLAGRSAYAASKGGLLAMTKVMAMELAPGIRVNAVLPGAVDTPMVRNVFSGAALDRVVERYALKRLGRAGEIADAIVFLLSDESSFMTGSTLVVDGGRLFH